jgi:hypothetical protein
MRPNLFMIGAPKCGTSSLFDWLASHPDIRGSRVKEPFFLTDPAHPLSRRPNLAHDGMAAYDTLFAPEDADAPVRMEATTHYLFDPVSREAIAAMQDARVITVLREPAARVYSSFQYTANNLSRLSAGLTFARFVALIEAGERLIPNWCSHAGSAYVLERDINYSRYAQHLGPWITAIGRNNIKILIMENMIRDPDGTVRQVLNWLGLDPGRMAPLDRAGRNRTEQLRMPALHALARRINARMRPSEPVRRLAKRAYGAIQIRNSAPLTPEDAEALRRLKATYAADNATLSRITGVDLSVWSIGAKAPAVIDPQ